MFKKNKKREKEYYDDFNFIHILYDLSKCFLCKYAQTRLNSSSFIHFFPRIHFPNFRHFNSHPFRHHPISSRDMLTYSLHVYSITQYIFCLIKQWKIWSSEISQRAKCFCCSSLNWRNLNFLHTKMESWNLTRQSRTSKVQKSRKSILLLQRSAHIDSHLTAETTRLCFYLKTSVDNFYGK